MITTFDKALAAFIVAALTLGGVFWSPLMEYATPEIITPLASIIAGLVVYRWPNVK